MKNKFYITTSIMYATRKPHFGNTYEAIMADAVARYKRQMGYDVFFLTGSDEHGAKIETCAKNEGIAPKAFVDNITDEIKNLWKTMNISYDKYIRTTDDYHKKAVQNIFEKLYEQGDIYKGEHEGWYCLPDESFFTDTQVVDGNCPECGRPVKRMKEEAYFLKISKYQEWLLQYIENHPGFIEPEQRKKEMINNFIKPGLRDLNVSRKSINWGVPVTFDPDHVIYVWIDALSNYITALGYGVENKSDFYKEYWPADVHIIGKDIVRFHLIYWPIILKALGEPIPEKIFGHPWYNFANDKMSKSRGNVVYADDLANKYGTDGVRYYALSEMPYAADGNFTYDNFFARYNNDLANNLGNLVNRTMAMVKKYFNGIVPHPDIELPLDGELKDAIVSADEELCKNMDNLHIADALENIFVMLRRANKYIDETAPWILAKSETDFPRLATVIYNLLETIRIGAVLLTPFIPSTAENILKQLNTDVTVRTFGGLKAGGSVGEAEVLFNRIDENKINEYQQNAEESNTEGILKIGIDEFMNVELRSAEITACDIIPNAKKLLKLSLDLGYEKRQVVSGIAEFYRPEDLTGKKVIVVANLKPAILRGTESNGMILASGEKTVRVVFLDPETPNGERIR